MKRKMERFSWVPSGVRWGAIRVLDAAFPRPCEGCGRALGAGERAVCWDCLAAIPKVTHPYCCLCGDPVDGVIDDAYTCLYCTRKRPPFRYARSAIRYRDLGRRMIASFKYRDGLWLQPVLADLLAAAAASLPASDHDAVCEIPLHPRRRRERGYNQSRLLARTLAVRLGLPLLPVGILQRTRETATQTNLTARERMSNVKGAFTCKETGRIEGRTLLVVDDVMTTGATVAEVADRIIKAGARHVDVVTVARG